MAVSVNMFNANNLQVTVNVNNGVSGFTIAGAVGPNWSPQTPATNPTFAQAPPAAGVFGIGTNSVALTPSGSPSPFIAPITLPGTVNWQSIQIYIWFLSADSCAWTVLNAGQVVSQGGTVSDAIGGSSARADHEGSPGVQPRVK
jgi:hypothetical protein